MRTQLLEHRRSWRALSPQEKQVRLAALRQRQQAEIEREARRLRVR